MFYFFVSVYCIKGQPIVMLIKFSILIFYGPDAFPDVQPTVSEH